MCVCSAKSQPQRCRDPEDLCIGCSEIVQGNGAINILQSSADERQLGEFFCHAPYMADKQIKRFDKDVLNAYTVPITLSATKRLSAATAAVDAEEIHPVLYCLACKEDGIETKFEHLHTKR